MKKIVILSLMLSVNLSYSQERIFPAGQHTTEEVPTTNYHNYDLPIAVKNISGSEVNVRLNPFEYRHANVFLESTRRWETGWVESPRGAIFIAASQLPPATITEPGKLYNNSSITIGRIAERSYAPRPKIKTIDVNDNKQTPGGGTYDHAGLAYPELNRQSFLHYLIVPGGKAVQVPEILVGGGVVTMDQYIIHADGHVTRENNLPCEKCNPPAGKTTASVDSNGNLVWI